MKLSIILAICGCLLATTTASIFARIPEEDQGDGGSDEGRRLIRTSDAPEGEKWMTEDEILNLIRDDVNFMDVTGHNFPNAVRASKGFPASTQFQHVVRSIIPDINIPRMRSFLESLSSFHTRYYTSTTGVSSSEWLLAQVSQAISTSNYTGNASVQAFTHASWPQKSVVARIQGASSSNLSSEVIVLGAHLDSINRNNPSNGNSPGADDDGSGDVVLLETLRLLLAGNFIPRRTIEFQWYAAEEVGLRGSADIARAYTNQGVDVVAMVNFDVVGYYVAGYEQIAIITDYTNAQLNAFLRLVVVEYCDFVWVNDVCGYACSDHASWHSYGFPAAYPSEVVITPYIHLTGDTIQTVNFAQVAEFVKLAVGFLVEFAQPIN